MNKLLIKQVSILSAIFGAFLGLFGLVPFVRNISFITLALFLAPVVIIYLKKLNILQKITIQDGMIIGAISGVVSLIGYAVVFTVLDLLLAMFIKDGFIWWIASLIKSGGFFVYGMLVFFICVLNAVTNAFAGLTTAYVYDFFKNVKD